MPFKSKSQMRACFVKDDPDWDCHQWAHETKNRKKLPEKVKKEHMNFKEFLSQKEGADLAEGKIGRFLGQLAGTVGPTALGALGSASMIGGSPMGVSGAPGGIAGSLFGGMKGHEIGGAIGDELGDKLASGWNKLRGWLGKKKPAEGPSGAEKFKSRTGMDVDSVNVMSQQADDASGQHRTDTSGVDDYFGQRNRFDAASKTLAMAMRQAGYSAEEIKNTTMNIGGDNRVLGAWANNFHKMVDAEIRNKKIGTAKAMAERGIERLQSMNILLPPPKPHAPEAEPVEEPRASAEPESIPDMMQPSYQQKSLFGDDAPEVSAAKKKRGGGRRKKVVDASPGLFD